QRRADDRAARPAAQRDAPADGRSRRAQGQEDRRGPAGDDPGRHRDRVPRAAEGHVHARPQRLPGHRARGAQEGLTMGMTTASTSRRPLLDPNAVLFMRCLPGSAIVAVLLVILVRLLPAPPPRAVTKVEELPQRFAKLILEPAKKVAPPVLPAGDQVKKAAVN